jgi:transcription elongation factor Elf1
MTNKRDEKRREKRDSTPIFMPYTCPGCDKRGSVGFTLGSLPFDFTCSACGTPSHVRRQDELTVTLTFDYPPDPVSQGDEAERGE